MEQDRTDMPDNINILKSEISKTLEVLDKLDAFYREFLAVDFKVLGKKQSSAIILAEVLTDSYTCSETLFLRISQFFENHLEADKWHADLLRKMTLRIEGVREPVLSDASYSRLLELMKFRHFRRYYFEVEYDWDKLAYLQQKYEELRKLLPQDLARFREFLDRLGTA